MSVYQLDSTGSRVLAKVGVPVGLPEEIGVGKWTCTCLHFAVERRIKWVRTFALSMCVCVVSCEMRACNAISSH